MNGHMRQPPKPKKPNNALHGITQALLYHRKGPPKSQYNQRALSSQHFQLRQMQLNSKFLIRKRRLQKISKQNKNIFIKINTQKSKYAVEDMNKSYRSSSRISRRLSRMRALSRQSSSSRLSALSRDQSFTCKKRIKTKPNQKPIQCQTLDVNRLDEQKAMDLKIIFTDNCKAEHSSNKQNKEKARTRLPTLSQKPQILTQRNKFQIFRIKEELEDKYPKIFKTIPMKSNHTMMRKNSRKRVSEAIYF